MKRAAVLLSLISLSLVLPVAFSGKVLNKQGKPISPVGRYHIKPYLSVFGGITLSFTPTGVASPVILTGTPLNIAFLSKRPCGSSSNWVVIADDFPQKWVGIGGPADHPGKQIIPRTFNIQVFDFSGYKLVFCPQSGLCSNVDVARDENGNRLVLRNGYGALKLLFADA
ncbi:hypothetical protein VNO78_12617 [Psophocarpus tetragonolobus]|uniref:Uncharacterized protein n=1 Tax=Psophocarpus tetragonolobus TaxID=3891 RepID=A0AAN9SR20_PSOTE